MALAKVTYKGQVTIPRNVRRALGIEAGDSLFFRVENDRAVVTPVRRRRLTEFFGIFSEYAKDKPWPGMDAVRKEYRREGGEQLLRRARAAEEDLGRRQRRKD